MKGAMQNPRLSIVIPTFNHARFLAVALESICAQSFTDWEAIVVNNYSSDDTVSIVQSFKDSRIRLVNFDNKGVIAASRNYALTLTHAPLVAFLDSDDLWYPEKLDRCIDEISRGYDLVCHAEIWVGPEKRRRLIKYGPEARATYDALLLDGNCISTSAVVMRREWIDRVGKFSLKREFITAEDYELWLRLARDGAKIGFIEKALGEYLIHDGNQSRASLQNMQATMEVFASHRVAIEDRVSKRQLRRREAVIFYGGARGLQDNGMHRKACPYFLKAIFKYPWVGKFYAAMALNLFRQCP